jgi:hypothetical protein
MAGEVLQKDYKMSSAISLIETKKAKQHIKIEDEIYFNLSILMPRKSYFDSDISKQIKRRLNSTSTAISRLARQGLVREVGQVLHPITKRTCRKIMFVPKEKAVPLPPPPSRGEIIDALKGLFVGRMCMPNNYAVKKVLSILDRI